MCAFRTIQTHIQPWESATRAKFFLPILSATFGWCVGVVISHNPMSMIDNNNMIQATNMIFLVTGKRKSNKVQNFQSRSSINPYKCSFLDRNVQNKNNKGRALSNINCSDFVCSRTTMNYYFEQENIRDTLKSPTYQPRNKHQTT